MGKEAKARAARAAAGQQPRPPITRHLDIFLGQPQINTVFDEERREIVVFVAMAFAEKGGILVGADGKRRAVPFQLELARIPYQVALNVVDAHARGQAATETAEANRGAPVDEAPSDAVPGAQAEGPSPSLIVPGG